jgi:hypothetical protein
MICDTSSIGKCEQGGSFEWLILNFITSSNAETGHNRWSRNLRRGLTSSLSPNWIDLVQLKETKIYCPKYWTFSNFKYLPYSISDFEVGTKFDFLATKKKANRNKHQNTLFAWSEKSKLSKKIKSISIVIGSALLTACGFNLDKPAKLNLINNYWYDPH